MKPKKSKKANLENLRTIFFQIGMILTLSAVLAAFEWNSVASFEVITLDNSGDGFEEIYIPPTKRKEEKVIKPPVPLEVLIIKSNETIIEDPLLLIDDGVDWNDPVINPVFEEKPEELDEPVLIAEFMPTFQGKDGNYFRNYVAKNVRFPDDAIKNLISGTVYVSFVVDKDGSVTDIEVLRSVHKTIDRVVVKVIENSPRWEPGLNNGKYVRVKYSIAITFKFQ